MLIVNGMLFNQEEFHNGEVIFTKPDIVYEGFPNVIKMYFKDNRDITNLIFAMKYIKDTYHDAVCELVMQYCPYERMDREINKQMFSMKYFAEIIADLKFSKVSILDPHSEVCVNLLKENGVNVEIIDLNKYVQKVISEFQPDYICYPDKGAKKKYTEVLSNIDIPVFFGDKVRDLENKGRISEYQLVDAPDLTGKRVLIIDDICCLGGTAYLAAKQMKEAGASRVAFYISHCENGIFVGNLLKTEEDGKYMVDFVYTADTMMLEKQHQNIHIVI